VTQQTISKNKILAKTTKSSSSRETTCGCYSFISFYVLISTGQVNNFCSICWKSAKILIHKYESIIHLLCNIVHKKREFFLMWCFYFWILRIFKSVFLDGTNKIVREGHSKDLIWVAVCGTPCNCTKN
jgi:hypothetical protein